MWRSLDLCAIFTCVLFVLDLRMETSAALKWREWGYAALQLRWLVVWCWCVTVWIGICQEIV